MCMPLVPRLSVDHTPEPPAEPRFGLFAAANIVEEMDAHAINGVQYTTTCAPDAHLYPLTDCPSGDSPTNPVKTSQRSLATVTADAFGVYTADECFPGGRDEAAARDGLRTRLLRGERHVVEQAIYHGHAGALPYLRHPGTHLIQPDDTFDVNTAVGVLEQYMAAQGRVATIHTPRWLAPHMDDAGIVHRDGPRLRTLLGNTIVFGSGYTGEGPEGADEGDTPTVWLYATSQVTIRRTAVIEPATWEEGAFNPRTNTPFLLAERVYVVDWPCNAVAIRTNRARVPIIDPPPSPSPGLTVSPTRGDTPLDVSAAVRNWGNGPLNLDWGDGTESEQVDDGATATHTYTTAGTYTVTVTSQANPSATATATVAALTPVAPPTELDTAPSTTTVEVTWSWTQGDGPDAAGFQLRHRTPPDSGEWTSPTQVGPEVRSHEITGLDPSTTYEVGVSTVAADGRISTEPTITDTTDALDPNLTVNPTSGQANLHVLASADNHGNGLVTIDWGDGTEPETNQGDGQIETSHVYTLAGEHTATATSQADSTAQDTVTVTVTQAEEPLLTVEPTDGAAPLDVIATPDNHGNGLLEIDWGDGTATEQAEELEEAPHTFDEAGSYTVTATSLADPELSVTVTVTVT